MLIPPFLHPSLPPHEQQLLEKERSEENLLFWRDAEEFRKTAQQMHNVRRFALCRHSLYLHVPNVSYVYCNVYSVYVYANVSTWRENVGVFYHLCLICTLLYAQSHTSLARQSHFIYVIDFGIESFRLCFKHGQRESWKPWPNHLGCGVLAVH